MAKTRLQVKPTLPPETLARANKRAEELGASSLSTLFEALIEADTATPAAGLAAAVARAELNMREGKSARGRASIPAARRKRASASE